MLTRTTVSSGEQSEQVTGYIIQGSNFAAGQRPQLGRIAVDNRSPPTADLAENPRFSVDIKDLIYTIFHRLPKYFYKKFGMNTSDRR